MTLPKKNVEFEYLTSNSDRFTNDFMNFVLTDVPFFARSITLFDGKAATFKI